MGEYEMNNYYKNLGILHDQVQLCHKKIRDSTPETYEHGYIRGVESTLEWLLGNRLHAPFDMDNKSAISSLWPDKDIVI